MIIVDFFLPTHMQEPGNEALGLEISPLPPKILTSPLRFVCDDFICSSYSYSLM